MLSVFFFFFFKQKTAYEMRISDWSSDVCSSDLFVPEALGVLHHLVPLLGRDGGQLHLLAVHAQVGLAAPVPDLPVVVRLVAAHEEELLQVVRHLRPGVAVGEIGAAPRAGYVRSEEHTSELQSLMRISYAVFC